MDIFDPQIVIEKLYELKNEMEERGIVDAQNLVFQLAPTSAFSVQQGTAFASEVPVPASTLTNPLIPATAAIVTVQLTAPFTNLPNSSINVNRASAGENRTSINSSTGFPSNNGSLSTQEFISNSTNSRLPENNRNPRASAPIGEVHRSPAQSTQSNSREPKRDHSRTPASTLSNEVYTLPASASSSLQVSNSCTASKPKSDGEKGRDISPPRGKCKLCNSRESDCLILPCGHLVVCFACVNTPAAAMCPVCNSVARSVVRTFLA